MSENVSPPPAPPPVPASPSTSRLSQKMRNRLIVALFSLGALVIVGGMWKNAGTPPAASSASPAPDKSAAQQQEPPSLAEIGAQVNTLKQQEADIIAQEKTRIAQASASKPGQPPSNLTAEDLQRQLALQQAQASAGLNAQPQQRQAQPQPYGANAQTNGASAQKPSLESEVKLDSNRAAPWQKIAEPSDADPVRPAPDVQPGVTTSAAPAPAPRPTLNFNPAAQPNFLIPEGTVIEAVLTNRLAGEQPSVVDSMITADVYDRVTGRLVIPRGSRALGEANAVSGFGQRRLAVSFHRIVVPGKGITYAIPLDKMPGLSQAGDGGLTGQVNNHYASIFGASLAIGAIGGLAQIGNGYSGFGYSPAVEFRNGVSQSTAESSAQILNRFLNRMPTITIPEGSRVKIILTGDLLAPDCERMEEAQL